MVNILFYLISKIADSEYFCLTLKNGKNGGYTVLKIIKNIIYPVDLNFLYENKSSLHLLFI